jgi:hypothetical protein
MTGTGPPGYPADDDDSIGGGGFSSDDGFGADDGAQSHGAGPDPFEEPGDEADDDGDIAAAFRPIPGGAACYFEPAQAGVIRSLVSQVAELVSSDSAGERANQGGAATDELEMMLGLSGNDELPHDPVLARLLPDAYSDDHDASAEFRRYTEESLRSSKINSAQAVLASLPAEGGEVMLSEPECQQWLRALNDVRLALGVRLGITDESEDLTASGPADEPRAAYIWVYQWLAYLQDSLIEAVT